MSQKTGRTARAVVYRVWISRRVRFGNPNRKTLGVGSNSLGLFDKNKLSWECPILDSSRVREHVVGVIDLSWCVSPTDGAYDEEVSQLTRFEEINMICSIF